MRLLPVFILFIVAFCDASLPRFPSGFDYNSTLHNYDRIVGGELAKDGDFPWQVSIQRYLAEDKQFHFCGGSIAAPRTIISAGHCAHGQEPQEVRICVGETDLAKCQLLEVEKIIVHEKFDQRQIDYDISAFIMKEPIKFTKYASPFELPAADGTDNQEGNMGVVSGWGTTTEGGSPTTHLRYVEVPITSDKYCKTCYGEDEITDNMICAGVKDGGKDSCQGDSGGPLVLKDTAKLVGIVSWGYGCARPAYPGVYTKVSRFNDWITDICKQYP